MEGGWGGVCVCVCAVGAPTVTDGRAGGDGAGMLLETQGEGTCGATYLGGGWWTDPLTDQR